MSKKNQTHIVVVIIGLALAASALIMLIPHLFDSPSPLQTWAAITLGVVAAGFGGAALALRHARPDSAQG